MNTCLHTGITFRKASASGGNDTGPNCVEVGQFFTATATTQQHGTCVEVAFAKAEASNPSGNCVEVGYAKASKSTAMGNNCVTVGQARKAEASGAAGHCVTAAQATGDGDCTDDACKTPGIQPGDVVVRDSKLGDDSPYAVFTGDAWRGYVATVIESGMESDGNGEYVLRDPRNPGNILHFNAGEADAFRDGCTKGEFNYPPQYAGSAAV